MWKLLVRLLLLGGFLTAIVACHKPDSNRRLQRSGKGSGDAAGMESVKESPDFLYKSFASGSASQVSRSELLGIIEARAAKLLASNKELAEGDYGLESIYTVQYFYEDSEDSTKPIQIATYGLRTHSNDFITVTESNSTDTESDDEQDEEEIEVTASEQTDTDSDATEDGADDASESEEEEEAEVAVVDEFNGESNTSPADMYLLDKTMEETEDFLGAELMFPAIVTVNQNGKISFEETIVVSFQTKIEKPDYNRRYKSTIPTERNNALLEGFVESVSSEDIDIKMGETTVPANIHIFRVGDHEFRVNLDINHAESNVKEAYSLRYVMADKLSEANAYLQTQAEALNKTATTQTKKSGSRPTNIDNPAEDKVTSRGSNTLYLRR